MTDFSEDLDAGDDGMERLGGMWGDSDEESEGAEDYEEVVEEVGGSEGADNDKEVSGAEDTEADDEEVVGLEDAVINKNMPYNHRELTGNQ